MSNFESINQPLLDLAARAESRILLKLRRGPVLMNVLQSLISECSALQAAIIDVINLRGPNDAYGETLDGIGRIVGQDRVLFNYATMSWFTPDADSLGPDAAPVWCYQGYLNGIYIVDDVWYKDLISARIFRNFTKYGSIPEIQQVIKLGTGYDVSFYRNGPMEMQLIVNEYVPAWVITFILRIVDEPNIEGVTFSPFPATMNINSIFYVPVEAFIPDVNSSDDTVLSVSVSAELGATI